MANTKDVLEHINRYEKKLGTKFFDDWNLKDFPFVLLLPDGSLSTYGVEYNTLVVGPTCGPLKVILSTFIGIARHIGLTKIKTFTKRNPKAYAKLSGATLVGTTRDNGVNTYTFELDISGGASGRKK